jgi:hypothetical protein
VNALPVETVRLLLTHCARYFDEKASEREIRTCVDDLIGGAIVELSEKVNLVRPLMFGDLDARISVIEKRMGISET